MASTDPALPLRLTLLCCGATAFARTGGFAAPDAPLDEAGRRHAEALQLEGPALTSPHEAARQTAAAIGAAARIEPALADMDWGAWSGRTFADVEGEALGAWLADPAIGAPGGETFAMLADRAAGWLAGLAETGGPVLAITHPMTIRAILHATIALPPTVAFRIDLGSLSRTELVRHRGWRLKALRPAE